MCCFVLVLGFLGPRFAFLWLWLFDNDQVTHALNSNFWVPLAALLFLPWTGVAFVLCWTPILGVSGFGWFLVALGFFVDLATWSGRLAQGRYSAGRAPVSG